MLVVHVFVTVGVVIYKFGKFYGFFCLSSFNVHISKIQTDKSAWCVCVCVFAEKVWFVLLFTDPFGTMMYMHHLI